MAEGSQIKLEREGHGWSGRVILLGNFSSGNDATNTDPGPRGVLKTSELMRR